MNENLLQNIEKSDLSLDEQNLILFQYSEEMLARDLYKYFSEKYPDTYVFSNISASEQHHMDAVKLLIDRYNLSVPTGYGELTSLYNSLKIEGDL
jgi:hypothetical protein